MYPRKENYDSDLTFEKVDSDPDNIQPRKVKKKESPSRLRNEKEFRNAVNPEFKHGSILQSEMAVEDI